MAAARRPSAACCSSTRSTRSIELQADRQTVPAAAGRAVLLAVARPARRAARRARSIRPATPFALDPATGRVTVSPQSRRCSRCPTPAAARPMMSLRHRSRSSASRSFGLAIGSFLNVCIHRLPRSDVARQPAVALSACGYALRWFDNIPVVELRCCSADAAASAGRRSRSAIPIVELLTMAVFLLHYVVFGWTPLLVAAAAVRVRADRAVRDRSRAPAPAERHHAAGHRRRADLQPGVAARASSTRSSARCSAAASLWLDRRGLLSATRGRRAWAAATSRCWR